MKLKILTNFFILIPKSRLIYNTSINLEVCCPTAQVLDSFFKIH
jgi:hypothetical protein